MSAKGACTRYPCDFAYARREHQVGDDGIETHYISAGVMVTRTVEDLDNPYGWRVGCVSQGVEEFDDWNVRITLDDRVSLDLTPMEAHDLIEKLGKATAWAHEYNQKRTHAIFTRALQHAHREAADD